MPDGAAVTAAIVAGVLAGYGVALPMGAVGTYLVLLSARTSLRIGAAAALGVATADGLYALAATVGGSALAARLAPVAGPLRTVSGLVLIGIAVRTALTALARDVAEIRPVSATRTYAGMVGVTALNPTTIVYFTALVLGSGAIAASAAQGAAFVVATAAASASWQLLLAGSGALLGRVLAGRRACVITALGSSALIAFLAARLLV